MSVGSFIRVNTRHKDVNGRIKNRSMQKCITYIALPHVLITMLSWRLPCVRLFTVYLVCRPLSASSHISNHSTGKESLQPLESWGRSKISQWRLIICRCFRSQVSTPALLSHVLSVSEVLPKLSYCAYNMPNVYCCKLEYETPPRVWMQ